MANMAFDISARHLDEDGRLHVDKSHISKAEISPYYGKEIPGYEHLGLEPNKIYRLLRDPEELKKAVPTFERLPILSKHVPVTVDTPQPDLVIGAIGSDVQFNSPYLDADLCFWDATAIVGIDTGAVKELSCAYRYVPVMTVGEYQGQPYDGVMTEIRGNHLALVEVGRAGSDVVVADESPFTLEKNMKMTKTGKALLEAIRGMSKKIAADAALPVIAGSINKNNRKEKAKAIIAMDAEIDPQRLDNIIDAVLNVEQPNPAKEDENMEPIVSDDEDVVDEHNPKPEEPMDAAKDEGPAEKIKALLEGKVDPKVVEEVLKLLVAPEEGKDVAPPMPESDKKAAMDAAVDSRVKAAIAKIESANDARRDVYKTVGEVMGLDSADKIYGFALDHMGIDHKGITDTRALKAMFSIASSNSYRKPVIAQDSGDLSKEYPNLYRVKQA